MLRPPVKKEEQCGLPFWHPRCMQKCANIQLFAILMCCVIGVQGTYLGYMVAVLTSIERRFEIASSRTGVMLAMYDVGHTLTVLFVGYFGATRNKPRLTAIGVLMSAFAMFAISLPNFIYGQSFEERSAYDHGTYVQQTRCDPSRMPKGNSTIHPSCVSHEHDQGPYIIMLIAQLFAGISAAPFNTLAYVYIDDNVSPRQSPFYLGLLTSMYAFGPALGFGLGAICNTIYVDPGNVPIGLDNTNPTWIGAWWLGFLICGMLYFVSGIFMFLFPHRLPRNRNLQDSPQVLELHHLKSQADSRESEEQQASCLERVYVACSELPREIWELVKNPVYTSMVLGWIFGSYLVGGYGTYLPKYIETQYGQTASLADVYAAVISIGSIALSTAVGGYLLARLNVQPRTATICLICSWTVILLTYFLGMGTGCQQPPLEGSKTGQADWIYTTSCNINCGCQAVAQFDPVCVHNITYFSPCHAGCTTYKNEKWEKCRCGASLNASISGFCPMQGCTHLPYYIAIMFVGLFIGNLFFMTTMMVVLRCVYDDQKALALSFASCITNILGFIPSPIIFGAVIDSTCIAWHSLCPGDSGNCILYDNEDFKHKYHLGNAAFQFVAILVITFTYIKSRSFTFPEEEDTESRDYEHNYLDSP